MKLTVLLVAGGVAVAVGPTAHAAPPPLNFPDFTGFTVVTDGHRGVYHGGTQEMVKFATPDGVYCGINALGGVGNSVRCYGPVPGLQAVPVTVDPTAQLPCNFGVAQLHSAAPGVLSKISGDCPTDLSDSAPLAVGQKVVMGTTTCGVAPDAVTACIDNTGGGHGFVLRPSGSWTF
jgi:hypothetical protein